MKSSILLAGARRRLKMSCHQAPLFEYVLWVDEEVRWWKCLHAEEWIYAVYKRQDGEEDQPVKSLGRTALTSSSGVVINRVLEGVGIMLAEKWINVVLSVERFDHRCMQLRLLIGTVIVNIISCYAPQTGLSTAEKDAFYEQVTSPAILITNEMVLKAISKMKAGKAAGPSGIIIEMIEAAGLQLICSLTSLFNSIVYERVVPNDWHVSFIINLFKGKGDTLLRENYRGLKLQEHVMKVLEHILNTIIREYRLYIYILWKI